jgi:transcriptional regulator GlxA family with amidase domain
MRVAFVIFERMTALDFVGVYDPVTRLKTMLFRPDLTWDVCALSEEVCDPSGLKFSATRVNEPLAGYDLLIVPGGYGTRELMADESFIGWLRTAEDCRLKASVCTGSLLFGAAGFLRGKRAATHPTSRAELEKFCEVSEERVVDCGDVVTAGGVTAAIDLGLHLCGRLAGLEAREKIRRQMDYQFV